MSYNQIGYKNLWNILFLKEKKYRIFNNHITSLFRCKIEMPKQQLINQYFKNSFKEGKFFSPHPYASSI